jgi:hypothetical protein
MKTYKSLAGAAAISTAALTGCQSLKGSVRTSDYSPSLNEDIVRVYKLHLEPEYVNRLEDGFVNPNNFTPKVRDDNRDGIVEFTVTDERTGKNFRVKRDNNGDPTLIPYEVRHEVKEHH